MRRPTLPMVLVGLRQIVLSSQTLEALPLEIYIYIRGECVFVRARVVSPKFARGWEHYRQKAIDSHIFVT